MGCYDSSLWIKILIPLLLFFLPTALRCLTSGPIAATKVFQPQTQLPRSVEDQASFALLPETNRSSAVREEVATVRSVGPIEEGLARARAAIRSAAAAAGDRRNDSYFLLNDEEMPRPNIYRNPAAFYQSYMEMEKRLKVYVYEEGEPPLVHDGPCKDIYTTEGRFIHELEMMRGGLRTRDPRRAHIFFLPMSVAWMVEYIDRQPIYNHAPIKLFVADYVSVVASKHPYWNRTAGADHFMLSCHDWGPSASSANPDLHNNSIRALCNANTSEGFQPHKDVSIPEIHLITGDIPPQLLIPPPPSTSRPYLAFFAGGLHGPIRPVLLSHWKDRDPDLQVHQYLPKGVDYFTTYLLRSRFCLCPSGYEVASPRVVEAIYAECVPVIISKAYVLPFSDVLRWEEFSVRVEVEDIPRLKEILTSVSEEEIQRMREGLRAVRKHFVINRPPKRFDVFHMILHSVWLRRLNLMLQASN